MKINQLIIIVMICFSCGIAQAEIYRWTDKDGNVHFGDDPRGQDSKKLDYDKGLEPEDNTEGAESSAPPPPSVEQIEELTKQLRESREKREEERRKRKEELKRKQHEQACEDKRKQEAQLKLQIHQALEKRARETRSTTDRTVDSKTYNMKFQLKKLQQDLKENCQ